MTEWFWFWEAIQQHGNPSLCPNHWWQRSWSWWVLWRPTRPSKVNSKKDVLFIIGDWNAKVGSQEIPRVTGKFGFWVQNEAGQRLTEFHQENTLVVANTLFQQYKRWLCTWKSLDGQYWNQIDYDSDCSHEIKWCLLLERKTMTNLDSVFKSKDITLPTKVHIVKVMVFPVVM